jgi:hypothetical protein
MGRACCIQTRPHYRCAHGGKLALAVMLRLLGSTAAWNIVIVLPMAMVTWGLWEASSFENGVHVLVAGSVDEGKAHWDL